MGGKGGVQYNNTIVIVVHTETQLHFRYTKNFCMKSQLSRIYQFVVSGDDCKCLCLSCMVLVMHSIYTVNTPYSEHTIDVANTKIKAIIVFILYRQLYTL